LGAPDFVGIGAQRCGTTWWFDLLLDHPQVVAPRDGRKELQFFLPYSAVPMPATAIAEYHAQFVAGDGEVAGEWTPRYMADAWALPLLKRAAPDAKLLVLLRDPIERFRSGQIHRATRRPDHRPEVGAREAIERGRYGSQLKTVFDVFAPEQVLVLQYERCRLDPVGQYRRTLEFLGLEDHLPPEVERLRGTTMTPDKAPLWPDLLSALRVTYGPEVHAAARLVPDLDLDLWPHFAHLPEDDGILV
jgi:hypothetical protein